MNLDQALLMTGDWDSAEAELAQAIDADGLTDIEFLACYRPGWRRCAVTPPPPRQSSLAASDGDLAAAAAFAAAIAGLRERSTPTISPTDCSTTPSASATCAITHLQMQDDAFYARSLAGLAGTRNAAIHRCCLAGLALLPAA